MEHLKCLMFALSLSLCSCDGYKILAVFPLPSKSHGILGENLVKHLLDGGHEVTYMTPFLHQAHPKLHIIDISAKSQENDGHTVDIKLIMNGEINYEDDEGVFKRIREMTVTTLTHPNFQNILKDPQQKFDVIIGEYMFTTLYSTLQALYQCPFIWFLPFEPYSMLLNVIHGPPNPAYHAHYFRQRVAPYSFIERVHELWTQVYGLYLHEYDFYYKEEQVYLEHIAPIIKEQGKPVINYNELKYNASLILGNSQVASGSAIPLPPNYQHVGGLHIDENVKPLPENLKIIMDNAKNGVIYFSMGSNLNSKDFPPTLKRGLLDVFGALNQTVIWKFEEKLPDAPKNVHVIQWLPQQSILAHPNLVLFITHGGLLSVTEAVHFGTPLIVIPVYADQFLNAVRSEQKGFALKIDLSYNFHLEMKVAINKILDNPKYAAKVKELSTAFHDLPIKPKDAIKFWVQHVVRTRGAPHLRSIALQIPLYQRVYLDLLAVVLVILVILILAIRKIYSMLTATKNTKLKLN